MSWWRRLFGANDSHSPDPAPEGAGFGVPSSPHPEPDLPESLPRLVRDLAETHRVVLLTREGCHLCEDVERVVHQVTTDRGVTVARVTIDDDRETRDLFTTEVPVVIVDGTIVARWRLSPGELIHALEEQQ